MTKKKMMIIAGTCIAVVSLGCILFFNRERFVSPKKVQPQTMDSITQSPKEELITWDDPAGFSFQYPKGLTIDKHDEDTVNYAHVELTNPSHNGKVIVWVKDTTATAISQWLKNEKNLTGAVSVDTTIGGNEAKKVMIKDPVRKQVTATLDEDVLVLVEAEIDEEGYWQRVNDTILGSMTFSTTPQDEAAGEAPPAEADEEESVE